MKFIFAILVLFSFNAHATNYYWSYVSGNDGTGNGTFGNPWKTTVKLQEVMTTFVDGDSALFHANEIFPVTQIVYAHDYQVANWVLGRYGTGANPVFSGFQSVTGWANVGTNLWEATVPNIGASLVKMVRINGATIPMGRYPNVSAGNGGYLQYDNSQVPYNLTIFDADLPNTPSRIGQEIVVRKNRWVIDHATVTEHNNGLVTYSGASPYPAGENYGYFFQNHVSLLDENNEWHYNPSNKKMTLFSTTNPSTKNVQAAIVDTLFYFWGKFFMEINGVTMEGGNVCNLRMTLSAAVKVKNSTIRYGGNNGYLGETMPDLIFQNDSIYNVGNNGFYCGGDSVAFLNNFVRDCGLFPGMGFNDNQARMGVLVNGTGSKMWDNKVRNIGYNGMYMVGQKATVFRNDIDTVCVTADDGGGIYASGGGSDSLRQIKWNVIGNAIGQQYGTNQGANVAANGIYMDDKSANVDISHNVIFNASENGIYIHNGKNYLIDSNTIYNCAIGFLFNHDGNEDDNWRIRNVTLKRNNVYAKTSAQIFARIFSLDNDLASFGSFNNNHYYGRNPIFQMSINNGQSSIDNISIATLRSTYGYELNSSLATITAPLDSISIVVNPTASVLVTPLTKTVSNLKGQSKTVTVAVAPRSAEIITVTGELPRFTTQTVVVPRSNIIFK